MSIAWCEHCDSLIDSDDHPEFYRNELNYAFICDRCFEALPTAGADEVSPGNLCFCPDCATAGRFTALVDGKAPGRNGYNRVFELPFALCGFSCDYCLWPERRHSTR